MADKKIIYLHENKNGKTHLSRDGKSVFCGNNSYAGVPVDESTLNIRVGWRFCTHCVEGWELGK